MANYLSIEKRKQIFHLLVEGNGIRGINRFTGCSKSAITEIQKRYSYIVDFLNRKYIQDLSIQEVEADEIRTFVGKKTNVRWVYISLDRTSKLVINFHIGNRDGEDAKKFLTELSYRLNCKATVGTDSLIAYISSVKKSPYGRIDASVAKINLLRSSEVGKVLGRGISNMVETQNGNVRQHVSRLTRKTRCFSKTEIGLNQHLLLYFFYYNFIKKHKTIKTCPAVAAGLIETPFTFDNLLEYDLLFTETFTHKISIENYGRSGTKGIVKILTQMEKNDFIEGVSFIDGMKKGTTRGSYNKVGI